MRGPVVCRAAVPGAGLEPESTFMNRPFSSLTAADSSPMIDPFGRSISYLRVSVTDRCDFRCIYCMAEDMTVCPGATC
jgi:hypothetical protein